jgi:hypothetical protein
MAMVQATNKMLGNGAGNKQNVEGEAVKTCSKASSGRWNSGSGTPATRAIQ